MPANIIARASEQANASRGTRVQHILLAVLFAVCYLLSFGYHMLVWGTGEPASTTVTVVYHLVVLTAYGLLWVWFSSLFRQRRSSAARIYWTTLLGGLLFVGLATLISRIGRPVSDLSLAPATAAFGFDYETGVPLAIAPVIKMTLLSLLETAFAFLLLQRFRDLVLVKRTRGSQRNWYVMLGLMALASLLAVMKTPGSELHPLQIIAIISAVVFMVLNSLRLSWIVFLPFKEKMISIGLALLLIIVMAGIEVMGDSLMGFNLVPGISTYMQHYSFALSIFTSLSIIFGVLYCTTALLSLLFHLPTTSDFQQKAGEMAVMHSLSHLVSQVFNSDRLFSTICASPVEAGSAHAAWLAVADPQSGSLRPRIVATHNITYERLVELVDTPALYEDVLASKEPLLLEQAPADHRISARPGDGLGSLLAIPLITRDQLIGVLFSTKEVSHGFEQDDIEAISIFAAQAAVALDNARLFEEMVEKERLARELSIAREVQKKLLPQRLPVLEGLSMAASSVAALEVGGDYYDFIKLDDYRLGVIIADVSGKGTSAAFYMAEMQGIFQSVSRLTDSPTDFLYHANVALAGSLEKNIFISVIYGILDTQKEEFTLARAGHCPAAVISLNGEARYLRTQGLGLGLDRGPLFKKTLVEERIALQPGDVFVLYTDGVVESRDEQEEEYGYERLLRVLSEHRHEDPKDLHHLLLKDLNTFISHKDYDDDMTLVVLKWHGLPLSRPITTLSPEPTEAQPTPYKEERPPH